MEEYSDGIKMVVADASHEPYVDTILHLIKEASLERDSGIANRSHEYLATKMKERKAVIALDRGEFAAFCYIECWENKHYVAHSGLIVAPKYRGRHLATRVKKMTFALTRLRWPEALIYSLTNSGAVMHINASLGYVPVPFSEMTQDDVFWRSCGSPSHPHCVNCDVLAQSERKYCVCTGMIYDPQHHLDEPFPVELSQEVLDFIKKAENKIFIPLTSL